MKTYVNEREFIALCDLIREVLIDGRDNCKDLPVSLESLSTYDGQLISYVSEILDILDIEKEE